MTFSKTTTMAAAALLAVLFLGSSTHAAPIDPPTGTSASDVAPTEPPANIASNGLSDDVAYAFGHHVGGTMDTLVPDAVEGGLDGAQPNEHPLYAKPRTPVPEALYNVGEVAGKTYATAMPDSTVKKTIDGVFDATGKE